MSLSERDIVEETGEPAAVSELYYLTGRAFWDEALPTIHPPCPEESEAMLGGYKRSIQGCYSRQDTANCFDYRGRVPN